MDRFALAVMLVAAPLSLAAQELPFVTRAEYGALVGTISGDAAYEHLRFTTQFHKPRGGTEGLLAVAQYVEARAREYGLDEVRLIRQAASYPSWNARAAELWVQGAAAPGTAPEWRRVASLRQTPLHLADFSQSADVTTEIVDVGRGADSASYRDRDVRGKLALAFGPIDSVVLEAVTRRGAAGVVVRPDPMGAQAMDYPDQVRWSRTPAAFAFVLSHRQGTALAQLLAHGPRQARASVETLTDSGQGWQVMVEGVLRGTDPAARAIVLTGHMQEEKFSANDDGSGVANVLEISRALSRLIASGQLPRPRRTIRFWWTTEIGSERQYFADHPDEVARLWLNINQDMVGANQGQDVLRVQNITRVPWTRAHFLDEVAAATIDFLVAANGAQLASRQVPVPPRWRPAPIVAHLGSRHRFAAALIPFHNNTDHMTFTEAPIGLPAITFTNWPDNYIHTTDDDLWNIDRTQLERNAVAVAMMTVFLARAGDADAPALVAATTGRGLERVAEAYRLAASWLLGADSTGREDAYWLGRPQIETVAAVAARHVRTVGDVATSPPALRLIARGASQVEADGRARLADLDALWRELAGRAPPAPRQAAAEQRLESLRPTLVAGPREFLDGRGRARAVAGLHDLMAFEIANAVDGRRSGLDIYQLVSAEARAAGAHYYGVVTPAMVEQYLANLVAAGLVRR
ncbi:MAG: M28 family peptidase [Gemmatimonadetes bacterium]|nr:M28 family peptidase [Gemmatimonadota bacterium]